MITAPTIIDALAQHHCDGTERQRLAFDFNGLADARMGNVFVRDPPHGSRRHVTFAFGPISGVGCHVIEQLLECRLALGGIMRPHLTVGAELNSRHFVSSVERRLDDLAIELLGCAVGKIPD